MLELTSTQTHKVPGRGTVKVVETTPELQQKIRAALNNKTLVSIDGEGFYIDGIEAWTKNPTWGLIVRKATPG